MLLVHTLYSISLDDFNFNITFPLLCCSIPSSPSHGVLFYRLYSILWVHHEFFILRAMYVNFGNRNWYVRNRQWESSKVDTKLLACGARGPEFDSPPRHLNFRDWLSPASKSQYGWNTAKATKILNTTNQQTNLRSIHTCCRYYLNNMSLNSSVPSSGVKTFLSMNLY